MYIRLFILLFFSLPATLLSGQSPGISVSADKQKILLGEPFHLTLHAVYPSSLPAWKGFDSIPHFEFTEAPAIDSTMAGEMRDLNIVYTLTSFDSGHWVIPSVDLQGKWHSDSIPMDVMFSDFDSSQPYHPIKDILAAPEEKNSEWWWYVVGGALALLILLYFLFRKKKKPAAGLSKQGLDPFREAMMELQKIESENAEHKLYFSKLVMVFRIYLKRKKNIQSLQKTTDDLIIKIKELNIGKEIMDPLGQSLRMADMVKFAKYQPEQAERVSAFRSLKQAIETIESLEPVQPGKHAV